ncbi:unnamed protein product, partial [Ectocarpus sp. 12 AP-2014]
MPPLSPCFSNGLAQRFHAVSFCFAPHVRVSGHRPISEECHDAEAFFTCSEANGGSNPCCCSEPRSAKLDLSSLHAQDGKINMLLKSACSDTMQGSQTYLPGSLRRETLFCVAPVDHLLPSEQEEEDGTLHY